MSDHAADDTVPEVDESRRKFLIAATAGTGAVGAVLTAVPFVASWNPSESARAAGLPTEMLASLSSHDALLKDAKSEESEQPTYAKNQDRALKPEWLVLKGTCTHLGCLPKTRFTPNDATVMANWPGGFFCPCHGSKFDLAGRVFQGSPASVNLRIPPYSFPSENKLVIGVDATTDKGVA
jgi:ubiquinol-cytochrome c reductase iron-sulfur subunit